MVQEMPDQWADVYSLEDRNNNGTLDSGEDMNGNGILDTLPAQATAPTRRYAAFKDAISESSLYESAECLAMIVTRGGFSEDAADGFRTDEMADIDSDGAPEFRDGWGRPIGFIRWPAGYSSLIQPQNATTNPDPLDPMRISGDYALVPLIYSHGPGGETDDPLSPRSGYQIDTSLHWLQSAPINTTRLGSPLSGEIGDTTVATDNITNHDLLSK
jgi:hypothetical protein